MWYISILDGEISDKLNPVKKYFDIKLVLDLIGLGISFYKFFETNSVRIEFCSGLLILSCAIMAVNRIFVIKETEIKNPHPSYPQSVSEMEEVNRRSHLYKNTHYTGL